MSGPHARTRRIGHCRVLTIRDGVDHAFLRVTQDDPVAAIGQAIPDPAVDQLDLIIPGRRSADDQDWPEPSQRTGSGSDWWLSEIVQPANQMPSAVGLCSSTHSPVVSVTAVESATISVIRMLPGRPVVRKGP